MDLVAGRQPPVFSRAQRSAQTEILDGRVDSAELARILADLARFNGAMLGHWPLLHWLARVVKDTPAGEPLTLLDIGCGYGDLLRAARPRLQNASITTPPTSSTSSRPCRLISSPLAWSHIISRPT